MDVHLEKNEKMVLNDYYLFLKPKLTFFERFTIIQSIQQNM